MRYFGDSTGHSRVCINKPGTEALSITSVVSLYNGKNSVCFSLLVIATNARNIPERINRITNKRVTPIIQLISNESKLTTLNF